MENIEGILSNWDKLEADIRTGLHLDYGESKDLQDILDLIHELQITAGTVSPIRTLFNEHLSDLANPHEVQISISNLDVLQTLYAEYTTRYGADMNLTEFITVIVDIKKFATRADVDARVNLDKVMTPDVMEYITELHDLDTEAHSEIFRYKLPGLPLTSPPVYSMDPDMALHFHLDVDRNCPMCYHDINGRVQIAPANQLGIDFSYGVAAIPIFGVRRNILLHSKNLSNVSFINSASNPAGPFIISPTDDTEYLMVQEDTTNGVHGFEVPISETITGTHIYLLYIFPINRFTYQVNLMNSSDTEVLIAKFNLAREESTANVPKSFTSIQALPNGWYRVSVAFDATAADIVKIKVLPMLQVDPDEYGVSEYLGMSLDCGAFYQQQLTIGSLPVPPIFTTNVPVTCLGTKVTKDVSGLYNGIRGTFSLRYISSLPEIFGDYSQYLRLFNSETDKTVVRINADITNPLKSQIVSYNNAGYVFNIMGSEAYDPSEPALTKRIAFSYTLGYQSYGFTNETPKVFRLSYNEVPDLVEEFFRDIYETSGDNSVIIQLDEITIPDDAFDLEDQFPLNQIDLLDAYKVGQQADKLEIGYSSTSDTYLEGYLLNLRYYSLFSNYMNIEFLMDQYIPTT